MREIQLSQGKVALIDDEDYERLIVYKWSVRGGRANYARAKIGQEHVFMHRLILDAPVGMQVDHINGDTFDNRRSNLRLCTHQQNQQNAKSRSDGKSKYRGVHPNSTGKKWVAQIRTNGRVRHLGTFTYEEDAARAYDCAAIAAYGEFARPNIQESRGQL